MPDSRVPTAPCSKCGRPVAATAKRCIYCGTVQYKAAPGTPERAAEEAAALEEDKKLKRQAALYGAGVGMPKGETKTQSAGNFLGQLAMLFINPFAIIKYVRQWLKP